MTSQPPKIYDQLHFVEYLDGGYQRPPLLNWNTLQLDTPTYTQYRFKETEINPKPSKHPLNNKINSPNSENLFEDYKEQVKGYSHVCEQLLGQKVSTMDFPGGTHRSSFRLILDDGRSVIASRRFNSSRSLYESLVMRRLQKYDAPTPKHYAYNGLVMIQEELPGVRLSDALKDCSAEQYTQMMSRALSSLLDIHRIAKQDALTEAVPIIGCEPDWLISLIDRTALLGNYMGIASPKIPVKQIYGCLLLLKPAFIKWDARPGNAMLGDDGSVKWFDWEHCCARNPMDDMAWLLCDDAVPNYPEAEDQLIDTYLSDFADGRNLEDAKTYLEVFGVHHACIRLCRILDEKGADSWIAYENRVSVQLGSQLGIAQQLCKRASRWAGKNPMTAPLEDWLLQVKNRLIRL